MILPLIYLAGNGYLFIRTWQAMNSFPLWVKVVVGILFWTVAFALFASVGLRDARVSDTILRWMFRLGSVWMVFLLYMVMLLAVFDVAGIFVPALKPSLLYALPLTLCILAYGYINYRNPKVEHLDISLEKEYDGSPLRADGECRYVGGELLEGHYIESAVTNQSRTEPGTTLNRPTVVIRDQDGNDVSYMYDLAEEKMGVIRVNRIKLKITSGSVEIRFDPSNPHAMLKCEEYTCEGAVLSDHRVNVMISVYLDSVGECDNQIDFVTVTDSRGRDVSGYYDIETENGTLKILPPVS